MLEVFEDLYGKDTPIYWIFEIADDGRVRVRLSTQGFDGVEYRDATPNNAPEHDTVRIWNPSVLRLS